MSLSYTSLNQLFRIHTSLRLLKFEKRFKELFIVTPLQKIHIFEPYVASVGFVYNPEGRESLLRILTIEEYRAEKDLNAQ